MKLRDLPISDPLVSALLARAPRMNYMQLCRLLEARFLDQPGLGVGDSPRHEPLRFRPRARTGFPANEIASVEYAEGAGAAGAETPPTVRTTFLGLYGVDAAVPPHMIDDIVLREEGHEAVEAFLDQFNHRYATQLFRAWKKYRYPETFRAGAGDAHSRRLLCLAGFGWGDKAGRAGLPDARLLALLGLLIQRTRTPEGLAGVAALVAPGVEVRVDEFWPVMKRVSDAQPLGASANGGTDDGARRGLGRGYVLGKRLPYRSRAVRLTLRPAHARQAQELLPGARLYAELVALVRLYVGSKADVHMRMEMSSRFVPPPAIGHSVAAGAPRLGWTTALPAAQERVIAVALGVCEAFPIPAPNPLLQPVLA